MTILVVGATGQLGGLITRRLLEQSQEVRVLVRPQSDHRALVDGGARSVLGDLKDRASLDPACRGIDTVITTANSALRGGADNPQTVDLEGNRNLIDAARAAGVGQFIFTSAQSTTREKSVAGSDLRHAKGRRQEEGIVGRASYRQIHCCHELVGFRRVFGRPVRTSDSLLPRKLTARTSPT